MSVLQARRRLLLVPQTVPLLRHTFSGASLTPSDLGPSLTAHAGTFAGSGGVCWCSSDTNGDNATADVGAANLYARVTIRGTLASATDFREPQLIVRYLDANNYLSIRSVSGSAYQLLKTDGGSASVIATAAATFLDGTDYRFEVRCAGNRIEAFLDGVSKFVHVLSGGDTKYSAYTRVGLRLRKSGSPATAASWDDLLVWTP